MAASPSVKPVKGRPTPRPWSYVAWWVGLLLLHVANVLFYVGTAVFYHVVYLSNLRFQLATYSIGIDHTQYAGVSAMHASVAAVHAFYILVMVSSSIAARRLQFSPTIPVHTLVVRLWLTLRRSGRQQVETHDGSLSRIASASQLTIGWIGRSVSFVFGREGLLGVDNLYFDDLLVLRELVETTLQSYQVYRMSQLLPRLGLIRVYVVLLVANCWSVPFLYRVYRHQALERRIASLLCDAVLDTLSSMGITLLIFATYAAQYTDPAFGFPLTNWFNDEWFTSVYQEFQMMLVVSWGDMISRLVFAFGLLQCMDAVKDILEPEPTKRLAIDLKIAVTPSAHRKADRVVTPPVQASMPSVHATLSSPPYSLINTVKGYLHRVAPRCFMLWGVVIIVVHAYAESKGTNWPCKLHLRPWLSAKPACSLVQIDCHALGTVGAATSLDSAWTRFEPSLTAHVTIRHCPELTIPPTLQQFHRLTSMKMYNSTITSWPATAAITTQAHSALRALYFIRTEFIDGTLPPGLLTRDFPQTFRSFIASSTNLYSLPDDLHLVWPTSLSLALEASLFTSVPDTVKDLQPMLFSLAENPLASVPASLFEIPNLETLLLCNTLIQELPREVQTSSPVMYLVFLDGTNISTLWSWMEPIIAHALVYDKQFFNAHDSRFCVEREEIEAGTRAHFSAADTNPLASLATAMDVATPERLAYSKHAVACDSSYGPYFPLALEDAVSALTT